MHQVVADPPVTSLRRKPIVAVARSVFHLKNVRLDVVGKEIRWVARIGAVDRTFGPRGIASFLMRKGPHALKALVAWQVRRPGGGKAIRLLQHHLCLAMAKMRRVANPYR